jgi:hypothetical protein
MSSQVPLVCGRRLPSLEVDAKNDHNDDSTTRRWSLLGLSR